MLEYEPDTGKITDRGDVLSQLKRAGLHRKDTSQIKIHSRIALGPDGYLYFTSMDEQGENPTTQTAPTWGSHLWRIRPGDSDWEHLAHTREALIAVSCAGRYVYALGYFGHLLYQYDIQSESMRSVRVGSVGGHISRNLISDRRGHAYVPRLRPSTIESDPPIVTLVEYDTQLREVNQTPIGHYLDRRGPWASHGITAFQHMGDGSIVFTTHLGWLYHITPPADRPNAPAEVIELGSFHPDGETYIATMFTYTGASHVMGVSKTRRSGFEWLSFDLKQGVGKASPLSFGYPDNRVLWKHLLYGSMARDNTGNFYVVGTDQQIGKPVMLKLLFQQ